MRSKNLIRVIVLTLSLCFSSFLVLSPEDMIRAFFQELLIVVSASGLRKAIGKDLTYMWVQCSNIQQVIIRFAS